MTFHLFNIRNTVADNFHLLPFPVSEKWWKRYVRAPRRRTQRKREKK